MNIAPFEGPYEGTQRQRVLLRQFTSTLISQYMGALSFKGGGEWGAKAVKVEDWARWEVETLKGLTWHYVIDSQALASQRFGQRQVIRALFGIYANAALAKDPRELRIFPTYFRKKVGNPNSDELEKLRVVADVIASMSEVQVIETYQKLTGLTLGSALVRPPA
jgi:dGTPase